MKHLIYTLALAAMLPALPAAAQQTQRLTADKHNEYGIVYTLPTTALRIDVVATRTVSKAGPFYQYAKRYIGTDKVVSTDAESWQIISVDVHPYGVADSQERFLMQAKAGVPTFVCVDADGMLLAINKDVAAPALPKAPAGSASSPKISGKEYLEFVGEDFLASQSSAKRAQMLAESLMEVRDAKISLTRGTAETMPTDGRQLELMLASLAKQEAVLTAAFVGSTTTDTLTRSFTFVPKQEGSTVLFRLSDFAGFVGSDDYSGEPVNITIGGVQRAELPKDEKGETKRLPKDAVAYRIPGTATVGLTYRGATLFSRSFDMAQFGTIFGLAPSLFTSKKEPSAATFSPATGALLRVGPADL